MYNVKWTDYPCHVRVISAKWLFMKFDKCIFTNLAELSISGWTLRAILDTVQDGVYIHFCTHLGGISKYLTDRNIEVFRLAWRVFSPRLRHRAPTFRRTLETNVMLHGAIAKGLLSDRKMFRIRHIKMKHTEWREVTCHSFTNRKVANVMIRFCI